jgi:hypothetical protein
VFENSLQNHLVRLVGPVQPLHTILGIGFVEPRPERLEAALKPVLADPDWTFVDLRNSLVSGSLRRSLQSGERVVILFSSDGTSVPPVIDRLIRSVVDRAATCDLGDGSPFARRSEQTVSLLVDGLPDLDSACDALLRVPYWDFIPSSAGIIK